MHRSQSPLLDSLAPTRPLAALTPVLLASVLSIPACGGAQTAPVTDPVSELSNSYRASEQSWLSSWPEVDGPFLWRVERDGAVSHIFGTVHVGVSLADLPPVVGERLDGSETLIVEADTEDMSSPEVMQRMVLPPGESLRDMLGNKHWSVLVDHLGQIFPAPVLERLPPWMVQTMLTLENPASAAEDSSLDSQLVARARTQKKRLLYLETAEMQLELLATLIGVKELRETLDDVSAARRSLKVLLRAYRRGNLAALAGLTLNPEEMEKNPEHFELMLFARNRNWMTMLQRELIRGGVFVAVGAAHYVGEEGLLELLRKAGFRISRVPAVSTK